MITPMITFLCSDVSARGGAQNCELKFFSEIFFLSGRRQLTLVNQRIRVKSWKDTKKSPIFIMKRKSFIFSLYIFCSNHHYLISYKSVNLHRKFSLNSKKNFNIHLLVLKNLELPLSVSIRDIRANSILENTVNLSIEL